MEAEANAYFRRIEALGGVIPAIEAGFFQREIAEAAFRYQQEIDAGRAHDRRRQRLRGRRSRWPSPSWRWTRRATSGRSRGCDSVRAERDDGRGAAQRWRASRDAAARTRQPDVPDPGGGQRLRHARRDHATSSASVFGEYQEPVFF